MHPERMHSVDVPTPSIAAQPTAGINCFSGFPSDLRYQACYSWCGNHAENCGRCKCRACAECRASRPHLSTLRAEGPCDIYSRAGTPCVAAHSTVRALFASYAGPLYQLKRADGATAKISVNADGLRSVWAVMHGRRPPS